MARTDDSSSLDPESAFSRHHRAAVRARPPQGEIPALLPINAIIANNANVKVVLTHINVYSSGLSLEVAGRGRPGQGPLFVPTVAELAKRRGLPEGADVPSRLRVTFNDAYRTEAVSMSSHAIYSHFEVVDKMYVLCDNGPSGYSYSANWSYFLSPLPIVSFEIEYSWPEQHLDSTSLTIGVEQINEAKSRILVI